MELFYQLFQIPSYDSCIIATVNCIFPNKFTEPKGFLKKKCYDIFNKVIKTNSSSSTTNNNRNNSNSVAECMDYTTSGIVAERKARFESLKEPSFSEVVKGKSHKNQAETYASMDKKSLDSGYNTNKTKTYEKSYTNKLYDSPSTVLNMGNLDVVVIDHFEVSECAKHESSVIIVKKPIEQPVELIDLLNKSPWPNIEGPLGAISPHESSSSSSQSISTNDRNRSPNPISHITSSKHRGKRTAKPERDQPSRKFKLRK